MNFFYANISKRKNFQLHVQLNSSLWLRLAKVQIVAFTMVKKLDPSFYQALNYQ